jgi:hypothetical protein
MANKPIRRVQLTPEQREAARKAHEEAVRRDEVRTPEPGAPLATMDRIRLAPKRKRNNS